MRTFISFEEAQKIVLSEAPVLESEKCALDCADGRTLSGQVISSENVPPFASSAMDGFAVRSSDFVRQGQEPGQRQRQEPDQGIDRGTSGHLSFEIIEHIAAGVVPTKPLTSGTCARIMTGAPIPAGADSVIPRERAEEVGGRVRFSGVAEQGKHIRPVGEDIGMGSTVFSAGTLITPPVIGMLATLGIHTPDVVRRPVVAIVSSGDEIVAPDKTPGPAQIRNSNGPGLRAQVLQAGGICSAFEHCPDDPGAIRRVIESVRGADLVLFSGGVSVGDHDYVKDVLGEMGMEMLFWKVKQRPGKPLVFGKLGHTLVLGLPGNPVSSAMCFSMYAQPLIRRFLGQNPTPEPLKAFLTDDIKKVEELHYFSRGFAFQDNEGTLKVSLKGPQGSNLYSSVVKANCILHLPAGKASLARGSAVFIDRFPWSDLYLA